MNELTAIIPVHKMAGRLDPLKTWISEALNSGISVILIHDHGDKQTEYELQNIVDELDSETLTYISGIFNGPGAARNKGLSLVKTSFFCFWDSDDVPQIGRFLEMTEIAKQRNLQLVVGEFVSNLGGIVKEFKFRSGRLSDETKIALNPGIWRMIFSTQSFSAIRFQNLKLAEDQLFLAEVGFPDVRYEVFRKNTYQYEVNVPDSLTKKKNNFNDLLLSINALDKLYVEATSRSRRKFLITLIGRQLLTLIKNRKLKYSLMTIYQTLATFLFKLKQSKSGSENI